MELAEACCFSFLPFPFTIFFLNSISVESDSLYFLFSRLARTSSVYS